MNKRFKNRLHFRKEYSQHYSWLYRNKPELLNKYFPTKNMWTLEKCKIEALKYNTRNEWHKNNRKSYLFAIRNNLLEACCRHMKPSKTKKKKIKCIETGQIFDSLNSAANKLNTSISCITGAIKRKGKCRGLTFVYVDEK